MEISGSSSVQAQFYGIIQQAEHEIKVLKKEDADTKIKELKDLLIEYILANMAHNKEQMKEIESQVSSLIQKYSKDMENADELVKKLSEIEHDPKLQTATELIRLHALLAQLNKDVKSWSVGDFEGLNQGFKI